MKSIRLHFEWFPFKNKLKFQTSKWLNECVTLRLNLLRPRRGFVIKFIVS